MRSWSILGDSLFGGALGLQASPSQFWPLADCISERAEMNEWLLWWPKETRVLSVTPDLHQPLREPVLHGVVRGWQFQCVHVSPSPQQATTVRWILMNVPQTRVWTKEPALTTLVATLVTVLCLTQVGTAGQQARGGCLPCTRQCYHCVSVAQVRARGGVCSVRGSASTCVSVAQVRDARGGCLLCMGQC